MTIEKKIDYWLSNIHHGMRMQGEATSDPYSEFSVDWYRYVTSKEKDFDLIFREVVTRLGMTFNWAEYIKRINKSS